MGTTARKLTLGEAALLFSRRRILVAEDDFEMRWLMVRSLERSGFEVIDAESGSEALELIEDALLCEPPVPFDLIISDGRMPGCTGLQLLAATRERELPFILVTAFGTPEIHAQAKRLGAFAIFDKPFDVEDLMTAALTAAPRLFFDFVAR